MLPIASSLSGLGGAGTSVSPSATSSAKSGDIYEAPRTTTFTPTIGGGARAPVFQFATGDGARTSSSAEINPPDSAPKWILYSIAAVAGLVALFFILKKA